VFHDAFAVWCPSIDALGAAAQQAEEAGFKLIEAQSDKTKTAA
jgi:hypothetical protein